MPKTIEAVYENGVFKPLKKIRFKEHERVELSVLKKSDADEMTQRALSIIGIGESGLKDTARKHDEYLYGKRRHLLKRIKK